MKASRAETFLTKEFAQLAGVTVRTLHYYDQEGLLKPSILTEAGHRRYKREDLLRLQQILTLKYLGFSLAEIKDILANPSYEVRRSLEIQKTAIDRQIGQLQQVSQSLEQAIKMLSASPEEEMGWQNILEIVQYMSEGLRWNWVRDYYTSEQLETLQKRSQDITFQQLKGWQREWEDLISAFKAHRHDPLDSPAVQELASKMAVLINTFTQGDPGIERSLRNAYTDFSKKPEAAAFFDPDLHGFMNQALILYKKQKGEIVE